MNTGPVSQVSTSRELTPVRIIVLIVILSAIGPLIYMTSRAAHISAMWSLVVVGIAIALALPSALRFLPDALPTHHSGYRLMFAVWVALGLLASYRVVSLNVFMLDAENTKYAVATNPRPFDDPALNKPFSPKHNCFTSYMIGAQLAADGDDNIYDPKKYRDADESTNVHEEVGDILTFDTYQYPPTFLLLPRTLMLLTDSFFQSRTYWFTLNIIVFSVTIAVAGYWISGHRFSAFWLAWPLVVMAPTTLLTLQIGNVHFLIVSLSLLGMVLIEKKQYRLGGFILGYVIVAKIFPGVLLLYLLLRRQWRSVVWTIAAMAIYGVATLIILGPLPWQAFIDYQLPRLMSGDAFWFAREHLRAIVGNSSVMGIVYKLVQLGLLEQKSADLIAVPLMWTFTAVLLTMIFVISLAHRKAAKSNQEGDTSLPETVMRQRFVTAWLVIFIIGQLRSPFLPWTYGNIAILWLLAMLIPTVGPWKMRTLAIGLIWLLMAIDLPLPIGPGTATPDLIYGLVGTATTISICLGLVLFSRPGARRWSTETCSADNNQDV